MAEGGEGSSTFRSALGSKDLIYCVSPIPIRGGGQAGEKFSVFSPFTCWERASPTFSGFGELLFFTLSKSGAAGASGHGH